MIHKETFPTRKDAGDKNCITRAGELVVPELGVYRFDNLVVLKTATMPSALLECGVIVNPSEEAQLKGTDRQQKTVQAVRTGILATAKSETTMTNRAESSATENR